MKSQTLNGTWLRRIGKGKLSEITVPFSTLPVGHSECIKEFDAEFAAEKVFLKFYGITYHAEVWLNEHFLGAMLPYSEYTFEVTDAIRACGNELRVEIEDISPVFGPTEGWENYGGIIRDVELLYSEKNYIEDVFFYSELKNGYKDAEFTVEVKTAESDGEINAELIRDGEIAAECRFFAECGKASGEVRSIKLWSPDSPERYRLRVTLSKDGEVVDVYSCNVGFREFKCGKHRFLLNGEPIFLYGVCKHEMVGDSGHCPTEEQMRSDMQMIKDTGCNFVRLVHYPHNKKILDIADEIGLMVCEEPGLWWSDTAKSENKEGSLEVLKRTIMRDRNHPSIVFWLSFNECRFTEEYLVASAKLCREYDPTRLVSGANCMSNEDTLKYYNICGFDFYTMHPYAPTFDRARESAEILHDKPLLFTEWGGYFVYDNPRLLGEFIDEMYKLYEENSDEGALAGAFFWEWSELNDFNRGKPACIDGNLSEGLVDRYRNPRMIYSAFRDAAERMGKKAEDGFWINFCGKKASGQNVLADTAELGGIEKIISEINREERETGEKMRPRVLKKGPVTEDVENINGVPTVVSDGCVFEISCEAGGSRLTIYGMTSLRKGYPLGGEYGETAAEIDVLYDDGSKKTVGVRNGKELTTVFELNMSSRINPIAENSERFASFGYDKNFEQYVMNKLDIELDTARTVEKIIVRSADRGYAMLIYGAEIGD